MTPQRPVPDDVLVRPDFDRIERRWASEPNTDEIAHDDDVLDLLVYARAAASRIETLQHVATEGYGIGQAVAELAQRGVLVAPEVKALLYPAHGGHDGARL